MQNKSLINHHLSITKFNNELIFNFIPFILLINSLLKVIFQEIMTEKTPELMTATHSSITDPKDKVE